MRKVDPLTGRLAPVAVLFLVLTAPLAAAAASLEDFFGVYVGVAEVHDAGVGLVEERHMDIEITPSRRDGFRVLWTNVTLVDGRRDVPGVVRRVSEATFERASGKSSFIQTKAIDPFSTEDEAAPIAGDPLRWGKLEDDALTVFSFVVLPDGRYEMQTYIRRLTEEGLALVFERVVDGESKRRVEGRAVRAD